MAMLIRFTDGRATVDADHALKRARRRIRDLRREDPLTGLLNERTFRDILTHDWAVAAREQSTLAVVVFTFDDFPAYVDVFGRHAADSCLRRVGQTVQRCLRRASDVVGRQGDDKIVVLSHAADEDNVRAFAERIAASVRELRIHHPRSDHGRFVTVSHKLGSVTVARGAPPAEAFFDELLG
jgi:diguanylate cyclase (GGDEF)-like protein